MRSFWTTGQHYSAFLPYAQRSQQKTINPRYMICRELALGKTSSGKGVFAMSYTLSSRHTLAECRARLRQTKEALAAGRRRGPTERGPTARYLCRELGR